jgi:TPP-dependent trihydroxycyclohexane-1,2-dione (THcHDO) dehydratase
MRKSMLQLELKSRWLRRIEPTQPVTLAVRKPRKAARPKAKSLLAQPTAGLRPLSSIVSDYREALEWLDDIEEELAEWLAAPVALVSTAEGSRPPVTEIKAEPP